MATTIYSYKLLLFIITAYILLLLEFRVFELYSYAFSQLLLNGIYYLSIYPFTHWIEI